MEVRARAPLRLGLAGGGTDLRSYSDQFGGVVVNATIARYVNVRIRPREDGKVCFVSYDTNQSELHDCSENLDIREMPLFVAAYNRMMELSGKTQKIPMTIEAVSDSPVGSGLGTSSTLTVTLLKGLSEYLLTPLNRYSIAETAYEVEREECGFSGGLQDQYAASFGGFNQIIFRKNRKVSVRPIPIERSFLNTLESQMLLYFSGRSRESSTIIDSQIANIARGGAVDSLHSIKAEAEEMRGVLMRGDLSRLSDSIRSGWERKKETSSNITNPNIEQVLAAIEEVGISCAKVSGAGGGGFIFIIVPLESRNRVIEILEQFGGFTGGCRFVDKGVESWRA